MELVVKTMEKVVIKLTTPEIEASGFDYFWDKIRNLYKPENYDVHSIGASSEDEELIFIELVSKRIHE
jgi:hypothetical protein